MPPDARNMQEFRHCDKQNRAEMRDLSGAYLVFTQS
jgi:hypothetical protein